MRPDWFLASAHRYDDYPRGGPKVFAGGVRGADVRPGFDLALDPQSFTVLRAGDSR